MTVSTSEDESRRGPPNVRSTSEIAKPMEPYFKLTHRIKIMTDREAASEAARQQRRRRKQADRYLKNKELEHD